LKVEGALLKRLHMALEGMEREREGERRKRPARWMANGSRITKGIAGTLRGCDESRKCQAPPPLQPLQRERIKEQVLICSTAVG